MEIFQELFARFAASFHPPSIGPTIPEIDALPANVETAASVVPGGTIPKPTVPTNQCHHFSPLGSVYIRGLLRQYRNQ